MIFRSRPSFAKGSDLPRSVKDIEVMATSEGLDPTTGNSILDAASDETHPMIAKKVIRCSIAVVLRLCLGLKSYRKAVVILTESLLPGH
jgi:hypothetical protein